MRSGALARFESALGFRPRGQVRWLSPPELVRSGVRVLVAQTFASYADSRETQAVMPQQLLDVDRFRSADGHWWIDFVADLGDGFDATYTVAMQLCQQRLTATTPGDGTVDLPTSQLLILGGDLVYPTASSQAYEDRMVGPYRAASADPFADPTEGTPNAAPRDSATAALLALPGNHDWYDGLTSFMRMFGQGEAVGRWQTLQSRSYFAARLQPGWWLVGLDSQLGSYIDRPQLEYFHQAVTTRLAPGDAIILCAASPTWASTAEDPNAFNSLAFFEDNYLLNRRDAATGTLEPTGAAVRLRISGDKHHYARYAEQAQGAAAGDGQPGATQLVTCGLGGAYLMGTDRLAETIILPPEESRMRRRRPDHTPYALGPAVYPTRTEARALHRRLLNPFDRHWLPLRNPWFGFWMGAAHVVLFILLAAGIAITSRLSLPAAIRNTDLLEALAILGWVYGLPVALFMVIAGLRRAPPSSWQSLLFLVVQLMVSGGVLLLVIGMAEVAQLPLPAVLGVVAVAGCLAGSEAFALHLVMAPPGQMGDLKMTGLAYEGGKGFVRMHLSPDGELTLYPLLMETVVSDWEIRSAPGGRAIPVPAAGLPRMRLLEDPVVISRSGRGHRGAGNQDLPEGQS
ncbi:hypothetical protein [Microbacterium sp. A93]|uniref:hypothetical protein n=1 Tax=Microbacterium sp. A93 TaxID=3450716 RepID=UPI003F433D1D